MPDYIELYKEMKEQDIKDFTEEINKNNSVLHNIELLADIKRDNSPNKDYIFIHGVDKNSSSNTSMYFLNSRQIDKYTSLNNKINLVFEDDKLELPKGDELGKKNRTLTIFQPIFEDEGKHYSGVAIKLHERKGEKTTFETACLNTLVKHIKETELDLDEEKRTIKFEHKEGISQENAKECNIEFKENGEIVPWTKNEKNITKDKFDSSTIDKLEAINKENIEYIKKNYNYELKKDGCNGVFEAPIQGINSNDCLLLTQRFAEILSTPSKEDQTLKEILPDTIKTLIEEAKIEGGDSGSTKESNIRLENRKLINKITGRKLDSNPESQDIKTYSPINEIERGDSGSTKASNISLQNINLINEKIGTKLDSNPESQDIKTDSTIEEIGKDIQEQAKGFAEQMQDKVSKPSNNTKGTIAPRKPGEVPKGKGGGCGGCSIM